MPPANGSDIAGMPDSRAGFPTKQRLDELANLLSVLLPAEACHVAIYSDDGRLVVASSAAGADLFPAHVDLPSLHGMSTGLRPSIAVTRIDPADGRAACFFAVSAAAATDRRTMHGFSTLGAWFLSREFDLLAQARRLRQMVQEQEAVIDHISDGLLVVDRSGAVRYMNVPAGRILKLDPAKSIGRLFRELLDFEPIIQPIFETGEGYIDRELQIESPKRQLHLVDTAIPIRNEKGEVVSVVNTFREMSRVRRLSHRMIGDRARYRFTDILGGSRLLNEAVSAARRAARSDANVLIYGESGTGKELFAQAIHADGRRAKGPFVAINCASLPRDLIESELFGYVAGSFTGADRSGRPGKFELASDGTIFLDEISEMPLDVQAKLLRVLQERQVTRIGGTRSVSIDVRILAAANRDLRELVAAKSFREDLYYRLNVIRIEVPALRERRDDIDLLTDDFIRRSGAPLRRSLTLTEHARHQLRTQDWPGNVRQLQNLLERLVSMTDLDVIDEIPPDWLQEGARPGKPPSSAIGRQTMSLQDAERHCIRAALEATDYNITKAAELLGIARPTLYAKMGKYGFALSHRLAESPDGIRDER